MGKPKQRKVPKEGNSCTSHPLDKMEVASIRSLAKTNPWDVRSDIFKNTDVGCEIVKDRLSNFDDADTKTVITSKSFQGLNIKKKDKRKIKRTLFKRKVHLIEEAKEALKAKKKREKTVIVGDMKPLADSLPSVLCNVASYLTQSKASKNTAGKNVAKPKSRKHQQLTDINLFQQILNHNEYQKNPNAIIQEHLLNKAKLEN